MTYNQIMKRLVATHSQHFLRGSAFIAELVGHSNIRSRDTVLDVGAGSGAITDVLARRAGHVIAYEVEPVTAAKLRKNMSRRDNVEVVEGDFLKADLPEVAYKVFSNIPFSLSSEVVRKLCLGARPPKAIYLIVQKQFAQKLLAGGNHFHGALGATIAPWWTTRIRRPLRKTDFTPPPAVDTVLLEIKQREEPLLPIEDMHDYGEIVARCFAESKYYARMRHPKGANPSSLSPGQWVELFEKL